MAHSSPQNQGSTTVNPRPTTAGDSPVPPECKVLGTRPIRHDGVDKVTGRAIYGADVQLPNLIHGAVLRSPIAHGRIKSIDTRKAQALPGVLAVVTSADFPDLTDRVAHLGEGSVHLADLGGNCLASGKVLYKGHAVAAVAARDVATAKQACRLIEVEYEPLPAVTWVLDALAPDAPILHDKLREADQPLRPTNVAERLKFQQGDIIAGFAACHVVVEREFRTASVHQGYIEPQVATASWRADGHLTLWASTQGSFTCRQQTAELLHLPVSSVTVIPCEIGGGFGGKIAVYLEPVAALLSRKAGRPVKMVMDRSEVFEGTGPTPGSYIKIKLGADRAGKLLAAEAFLAYDAGAFPGGMIGPGCMCILSCYDIPNARVEGVDVCLNKPKTQAYRAPGATQAAFACESVVDELAEKLGIDPLEFRLKNAAKQGTRRVDGPVYPRVGLVETLEAAQASSHWQSPLPGPHTGRGIASGFWFNIGLKSSVTAHVNPDGTVTLIEGSTDIGGTRTSVAMQLAEVLGLPAEAIHPQVADTDSVGYTDVTGGSRVTFATGLAAYHCGLDLIEQLKHRAALVWDCDAQAVEYRNGGCERGSQRLSFAELAAQLAETGGAVVGRASVDPPGPTHGFGTHLVDVRVDPETGKVDILRYTAIQDAGKAIHPSYVEGQMQGGAVQGIGWALNEEYFFDQQARMTNASYLDYRMPTFLDLPRIETIIVEVPNPAHPYGVRGVGETPIVPPPAAIANAIYRATGVRMQALPMSPPNLWARMQEPPQRG